MRQRITSKSLPCKTVLSFTFYNSMLPSLMPILYGHAQEKWIIPQHNYTHIPSHPLTHHTYTHHTHAHTHTNTLAYRQTHAHRFTLSQISTMKSAKVHRVHTCTSNVYACVYACVQLICVGVCLPAFVRPCLCPSLAACLPRGPLPAPSAQSLLSRTQWGSSHESYRRSSIRWTEWPARSEFDGGLMIDNTTLCMSNIITTRSTQAIYICARFTVRYKVKRVR